MAAPGPKRRAVLLATPLLLPVSMSAVFRAFSRRLGQRHGYFAGFLVYWIGWCLVLPLWVLGRARLRMLFRPAKPDTPDLALLVAPPALGLVGVFPTAVRGASPAVIAGSAGIAAVNGSLEEVLWRGTYHTVFPNRPVLGSIYPAVGFAVWHYAPQVVFPNRRPGGATSLVVVAGLVGLLWDVVARRTGSIRGTTISHVLFDFSGLGARIYTQRRTAIEAGPDPGQAPAHIL